MIQDEKNSITEEEDPIRDFFTLIPHLADERVRGPHDGWLLYTITKIAGPKGTCWVGTRKLAKLAKMSTGKVVDSRRHLLSVGLLKGEKRTGPNGQLLWHLIVPALWDENREWARRCPTLDSRIEGAEAFLEKHAEKCSRDEHPSEKCSPREHRCSRGDTKEEPGKKNPRPESPEDFFGPAAEPTPGQNEPAEKRLARMKEKFGTSPGEIVAACEAAIEKEGSWTAPTVAGGSSSAGSPMLNAWLDAKGIDRRDVTPAKLAEWTTRLEKLAKTVPSHVTIGQMTAAVRCVLDKDGPNAWYPYNDPAVTKFKQDWTAAVYESLGRARNGSKRKVITVHQGNGPGYKEVIEV